MSVLLRYLGFTSSTVSFSGFQRGQWPCCSRAAWRACSCTLSTLTGNSGKVRVVSWDFDHSFMCCRREEKRCFTTFRTRNCNSAGTPNPQAAAPGCPIDRSLHLFGQVPHLYKTEGLLDQCSAVNNMGYTFLKSVSIDRSPLSFSTLHLETVS